MNAFGDNRSAKPGKTGPKFNLGALVRRTAAPDQMGVVRELYPSEYGGEWMYVVQFSRQRQTQPESALELLPDSVDPWRDLVDGRISGPGAYQRLLTFERIRRPASRVAASFGTAKAKLLPYQFKPLLKFLENPSKRLLIADDVGLGKTIEAGYILRELNAHQGIERCLIVVPARLQSKWKFELASRFDEAFELVRAKDIRSRLIEPLRMNHDPDGFRWITSYETIRRPEISDAIRELQPGLDLVILDEAHRVRNQETEQHRAVRELSRCADAMVMLSATPVQTSIENLFRLLSLLDPDIFQVYETFEHQLHANQPVVQALASIRRRDGGPKAAAQQLERLRHHPLTVSLTEGGFFDNLLERLDTVDASDRPRLVELQRDISELSLTGPFISRTRKIDVIPNKPERVPQSVSVKLTQKEWDVYLAVAQAFVRPSSRSSWGTSMALLTAMRQTASCLPAAVRHFESKGLLEGWSEELGWEAPEEAPEAGHEREAVGTALDVSAVAMPESDSKFAEFRKALGGLWSEDDKAGKPRRKVIVFAFFRGTLNYLSERLHGMDVNHRLIHGLVPVPEREARINNFVNDESVRVLLSSEVGSEGVDLQSACVIVNYDLPWNPMVVEQRIGRIDRLGQQSPVLTIINLVLENTVEDRILMRLYDRIDLFKNSIGEIDDILGERVEKLVMADLRNELTDEELSARVDQEADAFLNERNDAELLQTKADGLLAGDQSFLDELQGLMGLRKVPGPDELYRFLTGFLDSRHPGCRVPAAALTTTVTADLQSAIASQLTNAFQGDIDAKRVAGLVQAGHVAMTFDSDAYLRVGRTEFVSMHHPLIRLCVHDLDGEIDRLHRAFHLTVAPSQGVDTGTYLLSVIELEISGVRPRTELVPVAIRLGSSSACPRDLAQSLYVASLGTAESSYPLPEADQGRLGGAVELLQRETDAVRAELTQSESTLGAVRAARRRATQEATLRRKVESARKRLRNLTEGGAREAMLRMEKGRLRKAEATLDAFLNETEPTTAAQVAVRDIAVVLLRVEPLE